MCSNSARHGSERHGTGQFGSVCVPLQFSTTLEWAGLFTCRYSCAASTDVTPEIFLIPLAHHSLAGSAPRLSRRGQSVPPQQTTKQPFLVVKRKVRSFKTVAFDPSLSVSSWSVVSCATNSNDAGSDDFLRPISDQQSLHVEVVLKKSTRYCTQWKTPQSEPY